MDVPLVIVRTSYLAVVLLALLASACSEPGGPQTPIDDDMASSSASRDAGKGKVRDAGKAENDDETEVEPADDDVEPSDDDEVEANTDATADAGSTASKDAGGDSKVDAGKGSKDAAVPAVAEMPTCDADLTYEKFGKAFVTKYCTECHNSSSSTSGLGGIVLDSLPMIVKNKMYLKKDVAPRADGKLPKMPKGGNPDLTDEERTKFALWVDCGPK